MEEKRKQKEEAIKKVFDDKEKQEKLREYEFLIKMEQEKQ